MRVEPAAVAAARARTRLRQVAAGAVAGAPKRVLARRLGPLAPAEAFAGLDPLLMRIAADRAARERVLARAAAALHGPEIAAAVTAADRAALAATIDADMRAFAVRHRGAGRPGPGPAAAFARRFAESRAAVAAALAARLPAPVALGLGLAPGNPCAAAARCLDLALAAEAEGAP